MNHIYRLKRSGWMQQVQPVPETARRAGKGNARSIRAAFALVMNAMVCVLLGGGLRLSHAQQAPPAPTQLPQGGMVTRGSATIGTNIGANNALMIVNQSSQRAVINWNSFNVGSNARVQFNQPNSSAVVLNNRSEEHTSELQSH